MNDALLNADLQSIVLSADFAHPPRKLWRALTDGDMMARWMMPPTGFAPRVGCEFTFKTKPAGPWDGTISCKVLEVVDNERLSYSWRGGDAANVGYGSQLDTIVTFTLTPAQGGTRLRIVHSGFERPRNDMAFQNLSKGWGTLLGRIEEIVGREP